MTPKPTDRTSVPGVPPSVSIAERWMGLCWSVSTVTMTAALAAWDFRRLRSFWVAELSKLVDRQLRSPAFLRLTMSSLTALNRASAFVPSTRHSQEKTHDPGNRNPRRSNPALLQPGR